MSNEWVKTTLGDKNYFDILGSGIVSFEGIKDYLSTSSVNGSKIEYVEEEVSFHRRPSRANMQPVPNSVWFAKMKNTLKVLAADSYLCEQAILSTGYCGIHSEQVISPYLKQIVLTKGFSDQKDRLAEGSTQEAINTSQVKLIQLCFPRSTKEQTKIAEVLALVDQAIEQTEALIAKQQRIKTGLMQDLLTRGIDANRNLRSEQTHEFKDSLLGRIPKEWEVHNIQSLLANVDPPMRSGPFGSALLKEELRETGIPLLGIDNVFPEKFVRDFKRFVSPKKAQLLKRYMVRPNDLLITIMGTVGRCCVVPEDIGEALSSKHVWTVSLDQKRYSPYVACFQINYSPWVTNHFAKDEQGGIMGSIRSETLRSTLLPVPSPGEMERIENCLKAISSELSKITNILDKLASLKKSLMQALLSGRKPVTALLED